MLRSSISEIEPTFPRHLGLPNQPHFGIEFGFRDTFSTFRFSEIEVARNRADTFSTNRFWSEEIGKSANRELVLMEKCILTENQAFLEL